MYLSYQEIINLIRQEQEKHSKNASDGSVQTDKKYSRDAFFAIKDFEKTVRKYLAKKYN